LVIELILTRTCFGWIQYTKAGILCQQKSKYEKGDVGSKTTSYGTVARLHADPTFRADLEAAKAELAAVRAESLKPTRDCNVEASAMALQPLLAP
jgi:hypothetical protein